MTTETPVKDKPASKTGRESAPRLVHTIFATMRKVFGRAEDERETVGGDPTVEHHASWALTMSVQPDDCDGGFIAECAEVPGAMGQGETEDEALRDLVEAINAVVAVRLEQSSDATRESTADGTRIVSVQL